MPSIRPFRAGDERQLVALFNSTFEKTISPEHYLWKFRGHSLPIENVWVAAVEEEIVSHYAARPARLQIADQEHIVMVGADSMTSNEYRRQGIFTKLGKAAHGNWLEAGAPLLMGFPNEKWGSRRTTFGLKPLFSLVWMKLLLRPSKLARSVGAMQADNTLSQIIDRSWQKLTLRRFGYEQGEAKLQRVETPGAEFDELWQRARREETTMVVRDQKSLTERYSSSPDIPYEIMLCTNEDRPSGYIVYSVREEGTGECFAYLADLFTCPGDAACRQALLSACVTQLIARKVNSLRLLTISGSHHETEFRRFGFRSLRAGFDFCLSTLDPEFGGERLSSPDNWYLTGGDFDVM